MYRNLYNAGISPDNNIYIVNGNELQIKRFLKATNVNRKSSVIHFDFINRMNISVAVISKANLGKKYKECIYFHSSFKRDTNYLTLAFFGSGNFARGFVKRKLEDSNTVIFMDNNSVYNYYIHNGVINYQNKENNNTIETYDSQISIFDSEEEISIKNKINVHYKKQNRELRKFVL